MAFWIRKKTYPARPRVVRKKKVANTLAAVPELDLEEPLKVVEALATAGREFTMNSQASVVGVVVTLVKLLSHFPAV